MSTYKKGGAFYCDVNGPCRNLPEKEKKKIIDVKLYYTSMKWKLEH